MSRRFPVPAPPHLAAASSCERPSRGGGGSGGVPGVRECLAGEAPREEAIAFPEN